MEGYAPSAMPACARQHRKKLLGNFVVISWMMVVMVNVDMEADEGITAVASSPHGDLLRKYPARYMTRAHFRFCQTEGQATALRTASSSTSPCTIAHLDDPGVISNAPQP